MIIDDVHRGIQKNKKKKRVGRGPGSGHGKTSSRGENGYGSRSGSSRRVSFEGGQTPLAMRVAKRGFNNKQFAKKVAVVNVAALELAFENGTEITPEVLAAKGLAKGRFDQVKILGNGDLTKKLNVSAHLFSASAESKIQAAGGTVSRVLS
ncbi:50S ribosomal protein L15 [Gimesia sp.]|uniref:50S ribosomal protein L15 n=1 Tax=Gimesia sp. TaxID=2024833 RepID=UPI000C3922E1|nr:50S ribosomal protein L15 [Gimesia sp.]MAX36032.1 50S ribosomal protein L15 [Gimesia sp.]HBL46734.1 50S ribosomal protein L15 [Planctomycetaceae bacterium]|tara:strand:+ start:10609 stop:11061 length:453 start_codon:yes stop_codon:yes gene_type:complete